MKSKLEMLKKRVKKFRCSSNACFTEHYTSGCTIHTGTQRTIQIKYAVADGFYDTVEVI